jgi:hypothetical protein
MQLEFIKKVLELAGLNFIKYSENDPNRPEYSISTFTLGGEPSNMRINITRPKWFKNLKEPIISIGLIYLELNYFQNDFTFFIHNLNSTTKYDSKDFLHIFKEEIRELNLELLVNG